VVKRPTFLDEGEIHPVEKPVFVTRQQELAQLDEFLQLTLTGQGRVIFICGEAGSGKTALIQEFTHRAQEIYTDLIVASGNCNAQTGIGDPYLPFREVLDQLTGDIESRWAAGAISRDHARRLWNTLPLTARALVEIGPDLIDAFVPGTALIERVTACTPSGANWLTPLNNLVERKTISLISPSLQQSDLFDQFTKVLQSLARQVPLVLVVDDLQWADKGSISLLFHLGRRLAGSRILLLGAYRSEEVAVGREGERHPLEPVVNELQRELGKILMNMDQAERRDFIEALLDCEPNQLGVEFREMIYHQTRGQPLFTVELLRGLQERGDLVQNTEGIWIEGSTLDCESLPARVEAVIAERIDRLAQPLRDMLRAGSVEGEVFTAEIVARVQAADERQVVGRLSSELDRRHRLIQAQAIEHLGAQRVSRYRFRHILVQKYLYDNMDEVERAYLHEDVGNMLEELYGDESRKIAVRLARHFQQAGITDKAIHYLHQAGERALQLSAYQEAIAHLTNGLNLFRTQPEPNVEDQRLERIEQEFALQLTLSKALEIQTGFGPEVKQAFTQARVLGQQIGKPSLLCLVVGELAIYHYVRAELQKAHQLAIEALSLAQQAKDPLLVALGHWRLGFILFCLGEYTTALDHLEYVIAFYNPEQHHHPYIAQGGADAGPSALAYAACCLWCLGYPDQAEERSQEALSLAHKLNHPFSLADALCFAGCLFNQIRRDAEALQKNAEELKQLAKEKLQGWLSQATWSCGEAQAMMGDLESGIVQIQQGLALGNTAYAKVYWSGCFGSLAKAQADAGQLENGLATLADAFARVEETDERYCEAELYRLKGELQLAQDAEDEAEANFMQAIQIAQSQNAKSWELRAATDLARLWHKQGRTEQAYQLLAEIFDWFTEGFDTLDLIEARALLEEFA
jgi:predicted ATPase